MIALPINKCYKSIFRNYKTEQHIAAEFKEEIGYQLKMKYNLESTLPASIIIGPFLILTDHIKQFLVNKRQEIASKLLDVFANIMKGLVEDVSRIAHSLKDSMF